MPDELTISGWRPGQPPPEDDPAEVRGMHTIQLREGPAYTMEQLARYQRTRGVTVKDVANTYTAYRGLRWFFSRNGYRFWTTRPEALQLAARGAISNPFVRQGPRAIWTFLDRIGLAGRGGQAFSILRHGGKWLGFGLGRVLPIAGGILSFLDAGNSIYRAASHPSAADVVIQRVAHRNGSQFLTPAQLNNLRSICGRGISNEAVQGELRAALQSYGVTSADIDSIIQEAQQVDASAAQATREAWSNTICTGGGAAIGAIIGGFAGCGVFSVPAAILGAMIGASIGNLVHTVISATGILDGIGSALSSIGSFFSGIRLF